MMRSLSLLTLLALTVLSGCARYEFDVLQPPDLAQHIGAKNDTVVRLDPLDYHMRAVEGRLVLRIRNPTETAISLIGTESFVVDPDGQSHPLRSQTAAPESYIKVIIPPPRPRVEPRGPSFGIGIGTTIGSARHRRGHFGSSMHDQPRYLVVYDDDATYWDWEGESTIRMSLTYERNQERFQHSFVIARKKM